MLKFSGFKEKGKIETSFCLEELVLYWIRQWTGNNKIESR
jgi:hypothetical protein